MDGSLKAIEAHLGSLPNHKVQCNIVAGSVGQVSDSDIEFAKATGGKLP